MLSVRPRELRLVIQHHEAAMMTISCSSFIVYTYIHGMLVTFRGYNSGFLVTLRVSERSR